MTTTRVLSMANGLAYVEVTFDDAGNVTAVHVVNQSGMTVDGSMNGVPMTMPTGTDMIVPIPSPGYPPFNNIDGYTVTGRWPV